MFRIFRIQDASTPVNKSIVTQVQKILREQFKILNEADLEAMPEKLNNPLKYRFQTRLFVAMKGDEKVAGFALLLHIPDMNFCYLDFMAAGKNMTGRGLGGALYERVREESFNLGAKALLFECLPDDSARAPEDSIRKQNASRLAFYEKYGAYPLTGTLYETPTKKDGIDPPYLMMDLLGNDFPDNKFLKHAARAILERNYYFLCTKEYIETVVASFDNAKIAFRNPRYSRKAVAANLVDVSRKIIVTANEGHEIHHVRERGYVESPVRIKVILSELNKLGFMEQKKVNAYPDKVLLSVHDKDYVDFLKKACAAVPQGQSVYPYIFPIRNVARQPKEMPVRAGYYCIDTFTPLNAGAYAAARSAVDCALTAADCVLSGHKAAYALVRPPGHHAEKRAFGGFCYFANAAIAAQYMSRYGKIAILDVDYHHGNSQQNIFYDRKDILTVSIHGDPAVSYPYFTGFEDEDGEGEGKGYNVNIALPENITTEKYFKHLSSAIARIKKFDPAYLVIALGLDTAKADPTGTWSLKKDEFLKMGSMIGAMNMSTLVVQEGGYRTRTLGINAAHFFKGLYQTVFSGAAAPSRNQQKVKAL